MRIINVPSFLHDIFGEAISALEIILILGFGLGVSGFLFSQYLNVWTPLATWRTVVLFILVLDIAAGCVANFTRSTSDFYAARAKNRLVFIAIHVQPIVIALLLANSLLPALFVWVYTISTALVVNALQTHPLQIFVAGLLLSLGIVGLTQFFVSTAFLYIVFLLFMVKVSYSFAVNHYGFRTS